MQTMQKVSRRILALFLVLLFFLEPVGSLNVQAAGNSGGVIVHHFEKDTTTSVSPDEIFSGAGKLGEAYTTSAKTLDNFIVDAALPSNATGTYTAAPIEVTYYYNRKDAGSVTVNYYLQGSTTPLALPDIYDGTKKKGLPYSSAPKEIANFQAAIPGNANGVFTDDQIVVNYYYTRKDAASVNVLHFEEGTTVPLVATEVLSGTGKLGLPYTTTAKPPENYDVVTPLPTNASGNFSTALQTVTYYYRRKNAGKIIVHHIEDGTYNELWIPSGETTPQPQVIDGTKKLGLTYYTLPRTDIPHYNPYGSSIYPYDTRSFGLVFQPFETEMYYSYRRKNAQNITVFYQEDLEDGSVLNLIDPVTISGAGKHGLAYTTEEKTIPNLELQTPLPSNKDGEFDDSEHQVYYHYKRKDAANITVKHLENVTGQAIAEAPDQVFSGAGKLGRSYQMAYHTDLDNWTCVNGAPVGYTGTWGSAPVIVTFPYQRKDATNILVHHYEQGTTTSVSADETIPGAGKKGLPYTTSPKTIPKMDVVNATPSGSSGTFDSQEHVVTYFYKRHNADDIIVHHYEQGTSNSVSPDETMSGEAKLGATYTATPKTDLDNWQVVNAYPTGYTGTYTKIDPDNDNPIVVTFYYVRKNAQNVIVHHYEENTTTQVSPDETIPGAAKMGATYTADPKTLADLDVITPLPANRTGTFSASQPVVTFYYKRRDGGDITIHHYEQGTTNSVSPDETLPGAGKKGLAYTTAFKNNLNEWQCINGNPVGWQGVYGTSNIEVTYYYSRYNAKNILVHHYEENTSHSVSPDEVISGAGQKGATYTATPKTLAHLDIITPLPANHTGTFDDSEHIVTFYYRRKDAGDITVHHYLSGTSTSVSPDEVLPGAGMLGLEFSVPYKENLEDYYVAHDNGGWMGSWRWIGGNPPISQGVYTTSPIIVTWYYLRKNASNVIVHHYEENTTTPLIPDEVLSGVNKKGATYTTTAKTIPNVDLVDTPGNATGTFSDSEHIVTYYYRRRDAQDVTVHHYLQGTTTEVASDEVLSGTNKLGATYTTAPKTDLDNWVCVNQYPTGYTGVYGSMPISVTYQYRRKDAGDVTVYYYEQGSTNQVKTALVLPGAGKYGLPYTTTAPDIDNFVTVGTTPANANGNFGTSPINIAYYYKRLDAGDITVHHYKQGSTEELAPDEVISGEAKRGAPYTAAAKTFDEWTVVTPLAGNATGTFTESPVEVFHYYRRKDAENVYVYHRVQGTETDIVGYETVPGAGKLGLSYTVSPKNFDDWRVVNPLPENATGTFRASPYITVIFYYTRKDGADVTVKYIDLETNTEIEDETVISGSGKHGLAYTTTPKTIPGFTVTTTSPPPINASGTFGDNPITAKYFYRRNNGGDVIVHHYEQGGTTQVSPDETLSGANKLGAPYTTSPKVLSNFVVTTPLPGNATGVFGAGQTEVTYYYRRGDAQDITVHHYEDGTTNELSPDETISGAGKLGAAYTTAQKTIDNYTLVAQPGNANGFFTNAAIEVIYYYKRSDAANVTVHHYKTGGTTPVASDDIISGTGKLGLAYTTGPKTLANYEVDASALPTNAAGTFTASPIEVFYYYKKKDSGRVIVHHYEAGGTTPLIADEEISGVGKMGETYNTSPATIPNYDVVSPGPTNASGIHQATDIEVTYFYRRKNAAPITVYHYKDGTTETVAPTQTLSGANKLGLGYTTSPATLADYDVVSPLPSNANGTYQTTPGTVTYYYKRKDAGNIIIHHYEEGTTNQLAADETLSGTGKSGETYTTSPKTNITNYELLAPAPGNATGNYPANGTNVEVLYYYRRSDAANVVVHHYEESTTTSVSPDEVISGIRQKGLTYTANPVTLSDYDLVTPGPSNATGNFGNTVITVTFYYKKKAAGDIIVHHYEEDTTTSVSPDVTLSGVGKRGQSYTTSSVTLPLFDVVTPGPSNASGNYEDNNIEVYYYYRRKDAGNVTVHHYKDGTTTELYAPPGDTPAAEVLSGVKKLGLSYTTQARDIENYEVVNANPPQKNGVFATTPIEVTYKYRRKNAGNITVHHYEQGGTTRIAPDVVLNGNQKMGEAYTTSPVSVALFDQVMPGPANANGNFTASAQEVIYYYRRQDAGDITVHHYKDGTSDSLVPDETISGTAKMGATYTTSPQTIAGYELAGSGPSNATGSFTAAPIVVTYYYKRSNGGNVIVRHMEENTTNTLSANVVISGTGKLGDPYNAVPVTIPNFELGQPLPNNANGTFTTAPITVTYYYKRSNAGNIIVHHYEDGTTNSVSPDVTINGASKLGLSYTTSPMVLTDYDLLTTPVNATGTFAAGNTIVTYYYRRKNAGNITIHHYEDATTNSVSPDETLLGAGKLGASYTTSAKNLSEFEPVIPGPSNANGTYTAAGAVITYYYRRKSAGNITVHHYEKDTTNQVAADVIISGANKLGLAYTTTAVTGPNFTLDTTPANASGTFTTSNIVVTYYYNRNAAGNITVHHYEFGTTNEIYIPTGDTTPSAEVLDGSGKLGASYHTEPKVIDNFDVVTPLPTNQDGTYTSAPITVIYEYRRKDAGNVVVHHYKQGTNSSVAPDVTLPGAGNLGKSYNTTALTLSDYVAVTPGPANANGVYGTNQTEVYYFYRRKDAGDVTIHYYELSTTDELFALPGQSPAPIVLSGAGKLGEAYSAEAKEIENFDQVMPLPSNQNGYFGIAPTTVIFYYQRKVAGDITVNHYEEGTTNSIAPTQTLSGAGNLGRAYTTSQASVADYSLVSMPANASGVFTDQPITINYYYRRGAAGDVIVHHYEQGTTDSVSPDEIISGLGKLGLSYTTAAKAIPSMTVVIPLPANASGAFATAPTVVTYYYKRDDAGNVIVNHIEDGTAAIMAPQEVISGVAKLGAEYITTPANIDHYEPVADPANARGYFTPVTQVVNYVYKRKDAGDVTVKYVDTWGATVSDDTVLSGISKDGLPYITVPKTLANMDLDVTPANATGTFTNAPITVTYIYRRRLAGDITVRHLLKYDNSELAAADVLSGTDRLGAAYTTTAHSFDRFDVDTVQGDASGVFEIAPKTVTYIYKRKDAGDVTIRYVDKDGIDLDSPDVLSGAEMLGESYTTTPKDLGDLELLETPGNASGTFTASPQTVSYVYSRGNGGNITVYFKDEETGSDISEPEIIDGTGKAGLPYHTSPKNIKNYQVDDVPANADGIFSAAGVTVTYNYRRKDAANVTIYYVNKMWDRISEDVVLDGSKKMGLPYAAYLNKEVDGYRLISVEGDENGIFDENPHEITYVYAKNPSKIKDLDDIVIPKDPKDPKDPKKPKKPHTPSNATDSNANHGGGGGGGGRRKGGGIANGNPGDGDKTKTEIGSDLRVGIDGNWEILNPNEQDLSKVQWIFVKNDGQRIKDWARLSYTYQGTTRVGWYHFGEDGIMHTGWYHDPVNDNWYLLSMLHDGFYGEMQTGWTQNLTDKQWYYLDDNYGYMQRGWRNIGGKFYYFTPNAGEPWFKTGTSWYYDENMKTRPLGSMYAGEKTPDGFEVDENGVRQ